MKAILHGVSGPGKDVQLALEPGRPLSIGRNEACTVSLPGDLFLSDRHLEIIGSVPRLLLRDLHSSNGTFLNGTRVQEQALEGGEFIVAGKSVFQLEMLEADIPGVLQLLSGQPDALYAVLDAARDPAIYPLLVSSGAQYANLYTGQSALKLEAVAPYLVHLPPGSALLRQIVAQGWSKSWGVFLTSSQPLGTIWHDLRKSLMVTLETTQKFVYFRFYDPRVLRVFLPIAEPRQREEFAGTASSFLVEDETGERLIHFHFRQGSFHMQKVAVRTGD